MKNIKLELEVIEGDGRAVCECGYKSKLHPWYDYLTEIAQAHADGHRAEGGTVIVSDDFKPEVK